MVRDVHWTCKEAVVWWVVVLVSVSVARSMTLDGILRYAALGDLQQRWRLSVQGEVAEELCR